MIQWFGLLLVLITTPVMAQEDRSNLRGITYGSPDTFAEFHGFADLLYSDFQKEGENGGKSTFDNSHFYLNVIARINPKLFVLSEIEWEHGGEANKVDRAYISWEISPMFQLRLGKFYVPFGYEIREYQTPALKLASRPLFVEALEYGEWVEVGVNAYGVFGPRRYGVSYDISVTNGPKGILGDVDLQTIDTNNNKMVAGRVAAYFEGLQVGVSYATGKYDLSDRLKVNLWGIDAKWNWRGLDIRGEYVNRGGNDDPADIVTGAPVAAKASGYLLQASYRFLLNKPMLYAIEPALRYDGVDPNKKAKDERDLSRLTIGVGVMPYPHYAIRAEYQMIKERHGPSIDNNGFNLIAVADF